MIISHKHKFIYIKTRKTAGSSIQHALSTICGDDDIITGQPDEGGPKNIGAEVTSHYTLQEVKDFVGPEVWNSYFKFTFVRNPWAIAVSRYHWNNRHGEEGSVEDFRNNFLKEYCSPEAHPGPAKYFLNDYQQFYTSIDDQLALDFVGQFETLKDDFKELCKILNLPELELPRKKVGFKPSWHKHYSDYYDEASIEIIFKAFFKDIAMFDYTFDSEFFTRRLGPIITPDMLPPDIGSNINGPSLIKVPDWIDNPLGKYYLYFAHHQGTYIRLAYTDDLEKGPWKIYENGTLKLEETPCGNHIASPDVHIDNENKQIIMYYHGDHPEGGQHSFVSFSKNGLDFNSNSDKLGMFYFRVFKYRNNYISVAKNGNSGTVYYKSKDGISNFEPMGVIEEPNIRHTAVHMKNENLYMFYSEIGTAPEHIGLVKFKMNEDINKWEVLNTEAILRAREKYEGGHLPVQQSRTGSSTLYGPGAVNELRDPYVFEDNGKLYLLYSLAGEMGIGLARLYNLWDKKIKDRYSNLNNLRK